MGALFSRRAALRAGAIELEDQSRMSIVELYAAAENVQLEKEIAVEGTTVSSLLRDLWDNFWLPQHGILVIFLMLLGALSALVALGVELAHKYLAQLKLLAAHQTPFFVLNYSIYIAISLAFALLAWWFVVYVGPDSVGSGIPEMKGIMSGLMIPKFLSFRTLVAKVFGLTATSVSGMSIGKEGPFVHVSSMIARNLAVHVKPFNSLWKNELLRQQILAAGCACGVAATFGAPVGGVLFSIEVTSTYYLVENYWKCFFASVCGALVLHLVGWGEVLRLFNTSFAPLSYDPLELFAFACLGVLCGLIGALLIFFIRHVNLLRARVEWLRSPRSRLVQVLAITAATVMVAYPVDFLVLGQKAQMGKLFNDLPYSAPWNYDDTATFTNLLLMLLWKFFFTAIAVGVPVVAGIFTPVFALGACVGRLFGELMRLMFPLQHIVPGAYAVVGAAAFASGVTRTFSTAVIVFEVTGQMTHMLPVLLGALLGTAIGNRFNMSIYDTMLSLRGLPILPAVQAKWHNKKAGEIMHKTGMYITATLTYNELLNVLQQSTEESHPVIPIVTDLQTMILCGTVQRRQLAKLLNRLGFSLDSTPARVVDVERSFALPSDKGTPLRRLRSRTRSRTASVAPPTPGAAGTDSGAAAAAAVAAAAAAGAAPGAAGDGAAAAAAVLAEADGDEGSETEAADGALATAEIMEQPIDLATEGLLDRSPVAMSQYTPMPRLHMMFVMLGLKHVFITDAGRLVGVVWREDLVEGQV